MLQMIYDNSPIFLQNLMVSTQGWRFQKERYNKEYYKELNRLRSIKNEFDVQEDRLNEFLSFIRKNSIYYSDLFHDFPEYIKIEDLKLLPLLDKETIRKNINDMVTRKDNLIKMGTGGSTGKSLVYFTHKNDISRKIAYLDFYKEKHGVKKGMRRVSIGGRVIVPNKQKKNIFWRFNKPLNQLLLSAYHADGENLIYYIDKLNKFRPQTIDGFTTTIHRLAVFILNNNLRLSFSPIAIFPTAEALTPQMKEDIEKAFGCPVRNQYASSEGAPFITENKSGDLEINPATGVFELKQVQDNIYELIVTGFYTTTTPILRYKIGDSVELESELPDNYSQKDIKIKRIIGRNNDFLYSNERGIVTNVNLSTVIKAGGTDIIDSQFIQNQINQLNINLVIDKKANKSLIEKKLSNALSTRFGNSTSYIFNYVESIEKTAGGKTRFTINNIKK